MALMEYCLVNIVLGDSPDPNEQPSLPERSKMEKLYDFTMRSRRSMSSTVSQAGREDTLVMHAQQMDNFDSPVPFQNGKRGQRGSEDIDPAIPVCVQRTENALLLTAPPPPTSSIPGQPKRPTAAQIRLRRAINIDRGSRVFFPLLFTILNCAYWYMFYEYL